MDGGVADGGVTDGGTTDGGIADGGTTDGGVTDGGPTDAGTPRPAHAWIQGTGGGGSAANAQYHLRLNLGAPQPLDHAGDAHHQVGLGPNAQP